MLAFGLMAGAAAEVETDCEARSSKAPISTLVIGRERVCNSVAMAEEVGWVVAVVDVGEALERRRVVREGN